VLYCVALCCIVLHCVVLCCIVLELSISSTGRFTHGNNILYPLSLTLGEPQSPSGRCAKHPMLCPYHKSKYGSLAVQLVAYPRASFPLYELLLSQTDCCSRRLFSAVVGSRYISSAQNVTVSLNILRRSSSIARLSLFC
jgi:hypothetical protein